jgi:hypothetical protein
MFRRESGINTKNNKGRKRKRQAAPEHFWLEKGFCKKCF